MRTYEQLSKDIAYVTAQIMALCNSYEAEKLTAVQVTKLNDSLEYLDAAARCLREGL